MTKKYKFTAQVIIGAKTLEEAEEKFAEENDQELEDGEVF